jgi:Ca2+-binding EF-hand superfamily protein
MPLSFAVLRRAFSMFDSGKSGHIEKEKVRTILNTLGHTFDDLELEALLEEQDKEGMFVCMLHHVQKLTTQMKRNSRAKA